ncbi:MAG: hypothetical protein Q9200_006910 [Gallowayella weberi]
MDKGSREITTQPFRLLELAPEIRAVLFTHLLPSVPIIDCGAQDNTWPQYSFSRHNDNDWTDGYTPQILRVNHQLYYEGIAYLYRRKTFVITVYEMGFDFLKAATHLSTLPHLPYNQMKEFIIRIPPHTLPTQGANLRHNLILLCGLLHSHGVHFKKLRFDFTDQESGQWEPWPLVTQGWDQVDPVPPPPMVPLWQYTDDEPENIPPEYANQDYNYPNFEHIAWRVGYSSTFAWLVSPLLMIHGIADECIIETPRSYRGNTHYEGVKLRYEGYLEGRYDIEEKEQDQDVQDCWWNFRHRYGAKMDCEEGCEECIAKQRVAEWMQSWRKKEMERACSLRETIDHEEVWKVWPGMSLDRLSWWRKGKRRCMEALERWLGTGLGKRVYNWILPGSVGKRVRMFLQGVFPPPPVEW